MTSCTTRNTSPAATRTGGCAAALPNDPGLDEILADPDLGSTAKAIVTVMVKNWAWSKDHCWPCDKTLAAKVGKSVGQVQRCLQELEQAGRIRRERTDEVPNGRRIWLLWRCPGGREGAQREIATARSAPAAQARNEIVIVNGGREPEIRSPSRPRPEPAPAETAIPDSPAFPTTDWPADGPTAPPLSPPRPQEPCEASPEPELEGRNARSLQALSGAAGGRSSDPVPSPVPAEPIVPLTVMDLGTIGRPGSPSPAPVAPRIVCTVAPASPVSCSDPTAGDAPRRSRLGLGLDLAELIKVVGETNDPILAKELARRTAPPAPPEPPPQALTTHELFAKLPGRHDLISEATRRLAEETGDFKPASWSFYQRAVEAVVTRSTLPGVLFDCHRQATGPKAKDPGKVFVVAWKRQVRTRC
jgi:hypothetical protein